MKLMRKRLLCTFICLLASACASTVTTPEDSRGGKDFKPYVPPADGGNEPEASVDLYTPDMMAADGSPDSATDMAADLVDVVLTPDGVSTDMDESTDVNGKFDSKGEIGSDIIPSGCSGPQDCAPPLLHCLLPDGVCVECLDAKQCADGLKCTEDFCLANSCAFEEISDCCESYLECGDDDICTTDYCADGLCGHTPIPECCETSGDCKTEDSCTSGQCVENMCQWTPLSGCCTQHSDCNDDSPCTSDLCVATTCTHEQLEGCCTQDGECEDGNSCTFDSCESGHCVSMISQNCCTEDSQCDDGDPCSSDTCILETGKCEHAPTQCCTKDSECEDGDPCTVDSCVDFACVHVGGTACVTLIPVQDVWLEGANANKKGYDFLIIGKTGEFQKKRSLVQFDLSAIPAGATVVEAILHVYYFASTKPSWNPAEQGIDRTVQAHRVLVPWSEGHATSQWAQFNVPWKTPWLGVDDTDAASQPEDSVLWVSEQYGWYEFNVTGAAQLWVADPGVNHGLVIFATNDDVSGMDMRFYSREHNGDVGLRPRLLVVYEQ